MTENRITTALISFQTELVKICADCDRDPAEITLVAVTKTRRIAEINTALTAGVKVIGENRIQDALEKLPELQPCQRHFIGHLQANKVREVVAHFDCVESVDSIHLAEKLATESQKLNKTLPIFLQVNLATEATKSGFAESELAEAISKIQQLPNLELTGLLVIGPHTDDENAIRQVFQRGKELVQHFGLANYSAGMSSDWQLAVECGATHLRLGRVLFGS